MVLVVSTYLLARAWGPGSTKAPVELSVHGVLLGMSAEKVASLLGAPSSVEGATGLKYAHGAVYVMYAPRFDPLSGQTVPGNAKFIHGTAVERGASVLMAKSTLRRQVVSTLGPPSDEAWDFVVYQGDGWRLHINFDARGPDGKLTFVYLTSMR